ncbi:hypothetical protein [Dyadobacter pollutisoli]|uniref:Uncharacterized protein n=1 Tax=Dyadobacter pollutisoli TaxID=2910158 RepID=A0A9E8N8A3_9BACT|nr:hypothetical protein [Dyadobacter pollutisoli]WAC10618.1 hypothetical protein ON006_23085 [Dyadobacter pollutisoli]
MKNLTALLFVMLLAIAGTIHAQTVPAPTQPVPEQNPVPTTPTEDKKPDFNSPHSPVRPPNTPSEDTLIKGQKSSGAVIKDTLMPSRSKRSERVNRRNSRKGTAEMDDTIKTGTSSDPVKKP